MTRKTTLYRAAPLLLGLALCQTAQAREDGAPERAPAALIAIDGDGEATLRWEPVPQAERYEVRRRLGISKSARKKPFTVIAEDVRGTSYVDDRARNGTAYYYTVRAVTADGTELELNPAKATPVALPEPGSVVWPLSGSSEPDADGVAFQYGPRKIGRSYDFHAGIDIPAPRGTPVYPVMDGVVTEIVEWNGKRGPGNKVLVSHGDKIWTNYLHLDQFAPGLKVGQKVEAGKTLLGTVGKTGAHSEHLHLTYMVGLRSEKTSEMRSKNPLEILPHTSPSDISVDFKPGNQIEITFPTQNMTARWIVVKGADQARVLDYYQIVDQGSKKRDTPRQAGLFLRATGLNAPTDARSHFKLVLRPHPAGAFPVERVQVLDFNGKAIAEARVE